MELNKILENLCLYDQRNPDFIQNEWDDEPIKLKGKCYCDNCFYGRTELALELLKFHDKKF